MLEKTWRQPDWLSPVQSILKHTTQMTVLSGLLLCLSGCNTSAISLPQQQQTNNTIADEQPVTANQPTQSTAADNVLKPFAWPFLPAQQLKARGGTTQGTPVTLEQQPS